MKTLAIPSLFEFFICLFPIYNQQSITSDEERIPSNRCREQLGHSRKSRLDDVL